VNKCRCCTLYLKGTVCTCCCKSQTMMNSYAKLSVSAKCALGNYRRCTESLTDVDWGQDIISWALPEA
jgi:hypothetical protein